MKKLFILIFIFLIGANKLSKAQDYEPLVIENAHWVVATHTTEVLWGYLDFREYYTSGDTNFNGNEYKKVYKYQIKPSDGYIQPPYYRIGNSTLFGLIREDLNAKKVYGICLETINPEQCFYTEELMFDFSVLQNDTLELCQAFSGPLPILDIYYTSVYGYYRKIFQMGGPIYPPPNWLIEGIGSTYGLFEEMGQTLENSKGTNQELICYTSGNISTCDIVTIIEKYNDKCDSQYTIFPNPATSFITINIKEGIAIEEAIIYNHLGQKVLEAVPVNNTVDVSGLSPGIYFIEVATKQWRERTKLIIKY